jgi:allophanate hydrolase
LQELSRVCHGQIEAAEIDVLITPTASCNYTIAEMEKDPVKLNSNLGKYTNYMNLLDLCGLAVPLGGSWTRTTSSTGACELPFGITLAARGGEDEKLLGLGEAIEAARGS